MSMPSSVSVEHIQTSSQCFRCCILTSLISTNMLNACNIPSMYYAIFSGKYPPNVDGSQMITLSGTQLPVYIRRVHNLRHVIFKLLNKFFLDIFLPIFWTISYTFLVQFLNINWTLLPISGDPIVNFSGSSPQNWHTLRKLLLFSGTGIANFSLDFPI